MDENVVLFFILICCTSINADFLHSGSGGPQPSQLPFVRYKRESAQKSGCLIPNDPPHGVYHVGKDGVLGEYAPAFTSLVVNCTPPYKPNRPLGENITSFCVNGEWIPNPQSCASSCRTLTSTPTTKVSCEHLGRPLDDCKNPVHDTIARVECELFHEMPLHNNSNIACKDGSWEYPLPVCFPVCGEKSPPKCVPNIIGGEIAKKSDFPWHVAVFNANNDNICGGSIISQRVVLSAAHCFTDQHGKLYPFEDYKIVAGKYYRIYDDPRDKGTQECAILHIHTPETFKATINNYEGDLAIIVLKEKLKFSSDVQPVCVDWRNQFEQQQLVEDNVGIVVGWGRTFLGTEPSPELKELQEPYKPYSDCYEQVPPAFRKFLTHDKICAGDLSQKQSICHAGSGSGLTFQRNQNRFYIRGILSTSPSTRETGIITCAQNQYATYTLISKYIDLIRRIENQNRS